MEFEVIRWITLGILWICIAMNVVALILNVRGIRQNKRMATKLKELLDEAIRNDWYGVLDKTEDKEG